MKKLMLMVVIAVAGCATQAPVEGPVGPAGADGVNGKDGKDGLPGAIGPAGDAGAKGDPGSQGIPGGALVNITNVDAGSACAAGGIQLVQVDGGTNYVCNAAPGAKGDTGATGTTGAVGATGATGPQGPAPVSLSFFGADGGLVGQALGTGEVDHVFINETGCIGRVDYAANKAVPIEGMIYYTGAGCTGTAFVKRGSGIPYFPMTCVAAGPRVVKAVQPVMVQQMNAQSAYYVFSTASDGGQTVGCYAWIETGGYGVAVQQITAPSITGPFTYGMP